MDEFHFLRPWWLLALIPLLALLWWSWRTKKKHGAWQAVCDPALTPYILDQLNLRTKSLRKWLIGLAGLIAIVALAGPAWQKLPQPVYKQKSALVVLFDLSKSMNAADLSPSRLVRARLKILDLLDNIEEGQAALVAYAGDAFVVTPLTDDTGTIAALVPSLTTDIMPIQGSRPELAIRQALKLLKQAGAHRGTVLLVTDGVDEAAISSSVQDVRDQGHRLSILGVGTAEGAPIPESDGFVKDLNRQIVIPKLYEPGLRKMASLGGGRYATMRIDHGDIGYLLGAVGQPGFDIEVGDTGLNTDLWREEGPWLLLFLLPIAMLAFRRGLMVVPLFLVLQWSDPVHAFEWSELWLNSDQLGTRAMEQEKYKDAINAFNDPQWKAAAYYRAGEMEKAAEQLAPIDSPEAHYNRGNALANLRNIPDAIEAYEEALRQAPDHEDAKYNLELLKQQMRQQQKQQSSESENEDSENNDSESSESESQEQSQNQQQQDQNQRSNDAESAQQQRQQDQSQSGQSQDQQQSDDQRQASEQEHAQPRRSQQSEPEQSGQDQEEMQQARTGETEQPQTEEDRATAQWLRRIPDDPGGLLRRKFRYQYSQRYRDTAQPEQQW